MTNKELQELLRECPENAKICTTDSVDSDIEYDADFYYNPYCNKIYIS